jgi:hypothetical protein
LISDPRSNSFSSRPVFTPVTSIHCIVFQRTGSLSFWLLAFFSLCAPVRFAVSRFEFRLPVWSDCCHRFCCSSSFSEPAAGSLSIFLSEHLSCSNFVWPLVSISAQPVRFSRRLLLVPRGKVHPDSVPASWFLVLCCSGTLFPILVLLPPTFCLCSGPDLAQGFFLRVLDGSFDGELICLLFVLKRSARAVEV